MIKATGIKRIAFMLACVAAVALLTALPFRRITAQEISAEGITPRSLTRKYDIIKIRGKNLGIFDGVPIKNLAMLALKDGKLGPMPFQIDERNAKGRYVMTHGPNASKDEDNGKLDANDELVFLLMDAGDRLAEKDRLAGGTRVEIEMSDPRNPQQKAWAYLAKYDGPAPRSKVDYVQYDPAAERIVSKYAIVGYRKGFMFYNDLIYPPTNGGNGKDFLDRIKLRISVDFLGGKMPLVRNEEIVTAAVQGWIDGPVRVIQVTQNKLKLFDHMPAMGFDGLSEYYPHMMSTPILVSFPFDITRLAKLLGIKQMKAEVIADLPGLIGGHAYSNLDSSGNFTYTGHSSKALLDALPKKGIVWGFATKAGVGTWFPRLVFPDPTYQFNTLYMTDNLDLANPPDDVPGEIGSGLILDLLSYPPEIGRFIADGSFELRFETYYMKTGANAEDARPWLDIQDHPLFVDVRGGDAPGMQAANPTAAKCTPWKSSINAVVTDTRGKKINLYSIAYFIGGIEVDARQYFQGERLSDKKYFNLPLADIKSLSNRYAACNPVIMNCTGMFSKLALKNGTTVDLLSCKMCGWGGCDENGRLLYVPMSQVSEVDFK